MRVKTWLIRLTTVTLAAVLAGCSAGGGAAGSEQQGGHGAAHEAAVGNAAADGKLVPAGNAIRQKLNSSVPLQGQLRTDNLDVGGVT